jgi:hypothetical protein
MAYKTILIAILLLSVLPAAALDAQPNKQYSTIASRKAFYTNLAKKYCSPDVQEILASDADNRFEDYVEGHSGLELIEAFETVIHELLHGYNGQYREMNSVSFFTAAKQRVEVPLSEVFSSRELNKFVRKGQQDSVFRYGLYVGGKPATAERRTESIILNNGENDVSSIVLGAYGLLEEYNAYYFGTLATWQLYPWYQETYGQNSPEIWSDYKRTLLGNVTAHHEFRLFIAWYLMYARKAHPDVYAGLMGNQVLRKTFTLLDQQYADLVELIQAVVSDLDRLGGEDFEDILSRTGTDEEIHAFLAENDIDADELGLKPGSPQWESLRKQFLASVEETKKSVGMDISFFHGQPKAQAAYLTGQLKAKEQDALADFRMEP